MRTAPQASPWTGFQTTSETADPHCLFRFCRSCKKKGKMGDQVRKLPQGSTPGPPALLRSCNHLISERGGVLAHLHPPRSTRQSQRRTVQSGAGRGQSPKGSRTVKGECSHLRKPDCMCLQVLRTQRFHPRQAPKGQHCPRVCTLPALNLQQDQAPPAWGNAAPPGSAAEHPCAAA